MKFRFPNFAVASLLAVTLTASAQTDFYLHKDDRVVFYGDSITEQYRYAAFIETYTLIHYPDLNVHFINSGWSGDWVVGGGGGKIDQRLSRDVIAERPTVATFMVGMNDAGYQDFDQAFFDVYSKGYEHLLETVQQGLPGLRIILFEPSPFDDMTRPPVYALRDGGYNKVVVRYGQFVHELARQHNLSSIDLNSPLVAVVERSRQSNSTLAEQIIPDRIHPSAAGALVMASTILKAWNASPIVSSVEIDAHHSRASHTENTRLSDLQKSPTLSWTQLDSALPLPVDPKDEAMALVVTSSTVVETLDQQLLKITSLTAPKYTLKIDGEECNTWSREDLQHGVNLALLSTPMLRQSLAVHALTLRRNAVRLARWQNIQVGLQDETSPHIEEALGALDRLEDEILQQQKAAAAPVAHHFELVPQTMP